MSSLIFQAFNARLNVSFLLFFFFFFLFFFIKRPFFFWWVLPFFVTPKPSVTSLEVTFEANSALWNGLVFIHPILTFSSFFFLLIFFWLVYYNFLQLKDFFFLKHCLVWFFFISAFFAVGLGSWWAQHEMNWGGWWGWDSIEFGSLFFFMISALLAHEYFITTIKSATFNFFLFFFIGVRLGFFTSVHSFISEAQTALSVVFLTPLFLVLLFYNFVKTSTRSSLVIYLTFFFFFTLSSSLTFIAAVTSIFLAYAGFLQRLFVMFLPVVVVPLNFLALRTTPVFHFILFLFFVFLSFFKPFFSFLSCAVVIVDTSFVVNDGYFAKLAYNYHELFAHNFFFVETFFTVSRFCNSSVSMFSQLSNFSIEILQQSLYVYGWQPLSKVSALYLLSTIYSFSFLFFLAKKKK